jgi:hypothetical protein
MDYIILQSTKSNDLAYDVREKLSEGWTLQGGVSVGVAPGGWTLFTQALIRPLGE